MHGASPVVDRRKSGSLANLQPRSKGNDNKNAHPFGSSEKRSSIQRRSDATTVGFYRGPECSAIDPFYTLPIGEEGQSQFLIYHCEFYQIPA